MKRSRRTVETLALACAPDDRAAFLAANLPKETARARGGRVAQAADHAFMDWLHGQHQWAVAGGVVGRIRHVGPPVRFLGPMKCEPVGKGPADFQGQLTRRFGSVSIAVEAKSREGRLTRAEIPQHQVDDLEACELHGGVAVLVYEHREGVRVTQFAMRWSDVPWRVVVKGSGPSIGPEECAPWKVRGIYWRDLMEGWAT